VLSREEACVLLSAALDDAPESGELTLVADNLS
jgi:hypothetical protein